MNYEIIERLTASKSKTMKKVSAALCMLIIASIMVVGSTYAWVVLSIAPEVTEITTTVGSNGALEIRLNIDDDTDRNSMFRNIVDFSNVKYGLDQIVLLPSMISPLVNLKGEVLQIPEYGDDGLATGVGMANKTFLGSLVGDEFYKSDVTGVRVVGSASGMTERQVRFDTALAAARSALSAAKSNATSSLQNDAFVGIVLKMVTSSGSTYTAADVAELDTIITKLEASVAQMQEAYKQLIIAAAASDNGADDIVSDLVVTTWGSGDLTLETIASTGKINVGGHSVDVPDEIVEGLDALQATAEKVASARVTYDGLTPDAGEDYSTTIVNPIISSLVNSSEITVNGVDPSEVDYNDIILNGAVITMASGAGVYADIADQCGDYSAQITKVVSMKTETDVSSPYISTAITTVAATGAPGADAAELPMTALYGYILDLGFKTNAKNSNLLLQTEAIDRVNQSNTDAESGTMGGGSYMSFTVTEGADITNTQVVQIMNCFRIVFFDTNSGDVIGNAYLDTDEAVFNAEGEVVAKIYMKNSDQVITSLVQNTERNISVLVYLDAENLMNEHVSATTATSVTGVMNLQFASDADLIPIDYGTN